ncbi:membrane protein [Paractinoplanes abujensis]|uniref:Putative membrane protein n=1 Tax=Paractinoplanes abujensis TaxID=882441 RepID=A0A7W7CZK4_9ACTN|nr:YhgE/Pip domain-containing protein [Actinoplanes abujensis]MBB4697324.1 putative membrane protein [Actinoplanes abujensis]GID18200.1 membrane protein [Actinoplanes abujensis]
MRGLSTLTLAGLELRRFLRGRLTRAAVVTLAVVPLLYGALYLYAFWDPYGRLNHIPAALVLEDRTATAGDGSEVHAGKDLGDELIEREIFDWHVVDEKQAEEGLTDGSYQLLLRIPRDFSRDLVSGPDQDKQPQAATLTAVSDDATNYLSGVFARSAFEEVRAAAAASASAGYFDKMLIGFTDLKQQTQQAADGAGKLRDGATSAGAGADRLAGGLDDAVGGAGRLSQGLGTAATGANDLTSGLEQLTTGARQLADGTRQAASGGRQLANAVDAAADKAEPLLRDNAQRIEDAAGLVARGADTLAANIRTVDAAAQRAVEDAERLQDYVDNLPDDTEGVTEARALAARLVSDAREVRGRIDLDDLRAELKQVAATARQVAAAAPHLADDVRAARSRVDQLATGLDRLATGAGRLQTGTAQAEQGAKSLQGGLYRLSSGARELSGGLSTLAGGGHRLADGLGDLQGGAERLASGLADGAEQIPGYGDDPSHRAGVLADPVALDRSVRHPAATYGVGFAPYFLALALWVGAMITFMVLRPLNRRYLVSEAPTYRVMLAGLLPAVAIGLVQATLLFLVVHLGLGLDPVHPAATWGLLALTAAVFAAIMQLLGAAFGAPGRILALALLMLQLTSSGGTYPVETSPGFFQAIHPLLPMTYVVQAARHLIDGGPSGTVVQGVAVLVAYGLGALALTVTAARRKRRMTMSDLHPALVL